MILKKPNWHMLVVFCRIFTIQEGYLSLLRQGEEEFEN